ncbi:FAD-dependent oxidoreductase [Marinilabilia rubra]|nr:FAD-dependent oxidoreductase [Marinilabilia rubra]
MNKIIVIIAGLLLSVAMFAQYPDAHVKEGLKKTSRPEIRDVVSGTLWVDAEDFADYGGWYHDTQFIYLMGSGYLLAPGMGTPVADAVTNVTLSEGGKYTLWIRSRNWHPEKTPGTFKVKVGDKMSALCGNDESDKWTWQKAGVFRLKAGNVELRLIDETGYYGRCDVLVLTKDASFVPPKQDEMVAARAKYTELELKPVKHDGFDVIVVGGGPAGTSAAIAAARQGARTALIQDRPVLGGNSSDEFSVNMNGAGNKNAFSVEGGIINEAMLITSRDNKKGSFSAAYMQLAEAEPNLSLFLNTRVDGVIMENDEKIKGVKALHTLDGTRAEFFGGTFIDCTGDGWLGYYAGAEFRVGREARSEFNEKPAPEVADKITMSASLNSEGGPFMVQTDKKVAYTAPNWAVNLPIPLHRNIIGYNIRPWWVEYPGTVDDVWEGEFARDYQLRITYAYADYLKNHWKKKDDTENVKLNNVGIFLGRRESRRLIGDYILTWNDVAIEGRWFDDIITHYGWPTDIHHPKGIFSGKEGPFDCNYSVRMGGGIPYRCIYSKNISNLLMAGRNVSVSHYALGTTRIMMTCATLGQAAGTAAAMCAEYDLTPRGVGQKKIKELQQRLLKEDQFIPRIKNEDAADLALKATATASSKMDPVDYNCEYALTKDSKHVKLTTTTVKCANGQLQALGTLHFMLDNQQGKDVDVILTIATSSENESIENLSPVVKIPVTIPAGFKGALPVKVNREIKREFFVIRFEGNAPRVFWKTKRQILPNIRSYKVEEGMEIEHTMYVPNFYAIPSLDDRFDFGASNVINGKTRYWLNDGSVNMWMSNPEETLPQWVQLAWDKTQTISEVRLVFDTNMNRTWFKELNVPERVSDYEIQALIDGAWKTIAKETGNIQRLRIHKMDPVKANKIRVLVTKTWGDKAARIFEVRVY